MSVLAVRIVIKFIIAGTRGCTSGNDSTRIFVVSRWIARGCWAGFRVVIMLLLPDKNSSGQTSRTVMVMLLLFALTVVMLADIISSQV